MRDHAVRGVSGVGRMWWGAALPVSPARASLRSESTRVFRRLFGLVALAMGIALAAAPVSAGRIPPGSEGFAINDLGQVVGGSTFSTEHIHAFR